MGRRTRSWPASTRSSSGSTRSVALISTRPAGGGDRSPRHHDRQRLRLLARSAADAPRPHRPTPASATRRGTTFRARNSQCSPSRKNDVTFRKMPWDRRAGSSGRASRSARYSPQRPHAELARPARHAPRHEGLVEAPEVEARAPGEPVPERRQPVGPGGQRPYVPVSRPSASTAPSAVPRTRAAVAPSGRLRRLDSTSSVKM